MKRIVYLFFIAVLSATLVFSLSGCKFFEREDDPLQIFDPQNMPVSEGLEYTLNEDEKSYTVSGIGTFTGDYLVIPESYEGLPVTAVGEYAFSYVSGIAGVVISNSITDIGRWAFYDSPEISFVVIGSNVKTIGEDAFSQCCKLLEIYNFSDLVISADDDERNYGIETYLRDVYTSFTEKSKQWRTEDDFVFYADGEECFLLGYLGDEMNIVLPESCNGKNYKIHDWAFGGYKRSGGMVITANKAYSPKNYKKATSIVIPEGVGIPNLHPLKNNGVF